MTDNEKLAQLLFKDVKNDTQYYENLYKERNLPEGARVSRFAPSPTGFLHLGGLFAAMISRLTAKSTGGTFFLRIEDTDKKREIDDGVTAIIKGLNDFGIFADEGVTGYSTETGDYGPYQQSKRKDIYHCFAKKLVVEGLAYPCFCSEEELNNIRAEQEKDETAEIKGYFGKWAKCRDLSFEQQQQNIKDGLPYVLRFRSPGQADARIKFEDIIKGKIEMPENIQDIVLLKTDGIPTYHFAHAVDDHLMRTTHVVRGDEWISSVPLHIQLFKALGFKVPKYAHISPIMKEDNGGKRKLSKRKDPEASVSFYSQSGYPAESVNEYLLTIANSNFEDWRRANKTAHIGDFPFNLKKMSASGALFDLNKLNDVSKNVISVMSAVDVYEKALKWAEAYDKELYNILKKDKSFALGIFSIDRGTQKPRKDLAKWDEIKNYISYFYNETYEPDYTLPDNVQKADAAKILEEFLKVFNASDDNSTWFGKVKALCEPLGFTPNVKEYKKNPELFKGHVGDVSTVIRIAVTSRTNTPDLCSIMSLIGEDETKARILKAIDFYNK